MVFAYEFNKRCSIIMKLHTQTPHELRMCPINFGGSKGQRSRSQCIDIWKWFMSHNCYPFTLFIMKLHTDSWWVKDVPNWFWGQKVRGEGHNALISENGLCCMIAIPFHLSSWNFTHRLPMSWGCVLLILGSKGQRSKSQWIDYWKWLLAHNCFPITKTIIKLSTQTPHQSTICPYTRNFMLKKTWGVWIGCRGGGRICPVGQLHSSYVNSGITVYIDNLGTNYFLLDCLLFQGLWWGTRFTMLKFLTRRRSIRYVLAATFLFFCVGFILMLYVDDKSSTSYFNNNSLNYKKFRKSVDANIQSFRNLSHRWNDFLAHSDDDESQKNKTFLMKMGDGNLSVTVNYNVHIFYYPWYGNPDFDGQYYHWNHPYLPHWDKKENAKWPKGSHVPPDDIGANYFPKLGSYSSKDPKVIDQHMQWIQQSGAGNDKSASCKCLFVPYRIHFVHLSVSPSLHQHFVV